MQLNCGTVCERQKGRFYFQPDKKEIKTPNKALHWTGIALRSIPASELRRYKKEMTNGLSQTNPGNSQRDNQL